MFELSLEDNLNEADDSRLCWCSLHNLATGVTGKDSGVGQVRAACVGHLRGDAGKDGVWPSVGIPVGECSGIHHCYGGLAKGRYLQEAGISRWSVTEHFLYSDF